MKKNNLNIYLYYVIYIFLLIFFLCIIYILFKPQYNLVKYYPKNIIYEQKIPKNIFQTYYTKNLPLNYKKITNHLIKQNQEYKYYLFDNKDMHNFVKNNYPQYWKSFNSIADDYIVAKSDFFRYMVIYHYGGVYFDIKSGCKIPLRYIIKPNDEFILPIWTTYNFNNYIRYINKVSYNKVELYCQWVIISIKNNPILKILLDNINISIQNYNINKDGYGSYGVFNLTGPLKYQEIIDKYKNNYKLKIIYYNQLLNNNLIYSYFNKNYYDFMNCYINNANKNIGYCKHQSKNKKRYANLKTPIIKNNNSF